jgi:DNA polymerase-3 subunit chi
VVAQQPDLLERIGKGLWERKDSFLAHGHAGGADDARQPILLSNKAEAANGARFVALADGQWREEALSFERAMLVFDEATVEAARGVWRKLDGDATLTRRYFKQEAGKWVQAA